MTYHKLIISCLKIGLSMTEFETLKLGTILSLINEYSNQIREVKTEIQQDKKEYIREATQKDIDKLFA